MIEAKEFWNYLCKELDYRFFAGVVCGGLKPLYDNMSSEFMHYVPAVNERVALGMVNGARLAGVKGAILMSADHLLDVINLVLLFNKEYKTPVLIICYDEKHYWAKQTSIMSLLVDFRIMRIGDNIEEKKNESGILFIGKGDIA
jgi:sulfopyruvate decarboxylase TPP-binding subunit